MSYYLSIVLCGRNDDYGRDYLKRLQTLISGLDYFCGRYGLSCQVVFVEWNPPAERARIKSVMDWGKHLGVKIITVPGQVDARLPVNRGNSGLHEFVAKNAGVRRADGEFVLCCTSDLVFSPELFEYLARRELSRDAVYRAIRVNVRSLPDGVAAAEAPELCRRNVVSADLVGERITLDGARWEALCHANAHFVLGSVPMLQGLVDFPRMREPLRVEAAALRLLPQLIHVNAAGDFTLVSRECWMKLGGYVESDCRNHVDAWFCFHAAKRGLAQVLLPLRMCVYHQEHETAPLASYDESLAKLTALGQNAKWGLADEPLGVEVIQEGTGKDGAGSYAG
jgi:hypothetical protein